LLRLEEVQLELGQPVEALDAAWLLRVPDPLGYRAAVEEGDERVLALYAPLSNIADGYFPPG
jgi:hypothetical protein